MAEIKSRIVDKRLRGEYSGRQFVGRLVEPNHSVSDIARWLVEEGIDQDIVFALTEWRSQL